jgi:hypothetical protein
MTLLKWCFNSQFYSGACVEAQFRHFSRSEKLIACMDWQLHTYGRKVESFNVGDEYCWLQGNQMLRFALNWEKRRKITGSLLAGLRRIYWKVINYVTNISYAEDQTFETSCSIHRRDRHWMVWSGLNRWYKSMNSNGTEGTCCRSRHVH